MATRYVEKPPHVDPQRISDIADEELVAALVPGSPGTEESDAAAGVDVLLQHVVSGLRPRPLPTRRVVVDAMSPPERAAVLRIAEAADPRVDFTDGAVGRSRFYGLHYLMWTVPWLDAHALTGDQRWVRTWADSFDRWYAARHRVRGEWSGLDAVWYTLGVATRLRVCVDALDTCGVSLAPTTRRAVLATVLGGCRWLAEEHSEYRPGNWQFVGACALLSTATLFPELRESSGWVDLGRRRITEHLDLDVYRDGGHSERAPGYHLLCLNHLREAAAHARAYADIDLTEHPAYARMHEWLTLMSTPEDWVPPLQDSPPVDVGREAATWAAGLPSSDSTQEDSVYLPPEPPLHSRMDGSGYVVSRSGRGPDNLYSVLNVGPAVPHELETHSHRALLDFVLWGNGRPLAWEAGGPRSYDDPEYQTWYRSTGAHNTVMLDEPPAEDHLGAAVDIAEQADLVDVFRGSYRVGGARHQRTFVFVRPAAGGTGPSPGGYWYVADRVAGAGSWRWRVHGRSPWLQTGPGAWTSADYPGLRVHVVAGENHDEAIPWDVSTGRTTYPTPQGVVEGILHGLELRPNGSALSAVLHPVRGGADGPVLNAEGDAITVAIGKHRDVLCDGAWLRLHDGRPAAAVTWLGGEARDAAGVVLAAAAGELARATWSSGNVLVEVRATGRSLVRVRAGAHPRQVLLRGVAVPWRSVDGVVAVTLPEAGEWELLVVGR